MRRETSFQQSLRLPLHRPPRRTAHGLEFLRPMLRGAALCIGLVSSLILKNEMPYHLLASSSSS